MSRWFRHYAGMMRDEKLVSAAVKSKQPVERVVWVWGAILESASEIDDGGRFEFDESEAAYFLRTNEADILAIVDALTTSGRIASNIVVKWGDRQFQSDKSIARQSAYRERKRAEKHLGDSKPHRGDGISRSGDGKVTSRDGVVTPQDTDTDTDTDISNHHTRDHDGWSQLEAKCREAAGWQTEPHPNLFVIGPIAALIEAGCILELDVLPTIRARSSACRGVKNWKYFISAIQQARDDRLGALTPANPSKPLEARHGNPAKRNSISDSFALIDAAIAAEEQRLGQLGTAENSAGHGRESLKLVS